MSFEEAKEFADSFDIPYFEVSAKSGYNVEKPFLVAVAMLVKSIRIEKLNFLGSSDENRGLCDAKTVSSFFKKSLKIVVEGCIVKLIEEKV